MNVHIVAARLNADRVLPRLARTLSAETGWTLGEAPNPKAQLNYFFPYLELQRRQWEGRSAAWFTHKDTQNPQKAALWNDVAARVDLRTLTAGIYGPDLVEHGPLAMVRPAVELDNFVPAPRKPSARRRVGLSGYLYNDNRKGEDLITRLKGCPAGQSVEWAASGRGWAVPTKMYSWKQLPAFYQSLDLFICASRIEGIPMPPLEILACGVPVIIPHGVGMLDDLPTIRGIYRFKLGDYDSLLDAFNTAIDAPPPDPESLRAAVAQYSPANWAYDHRVAFERLLHNTGPLVANPPAIQKGLRGVYCVAYGEPSRRCARRLINSIKMFMPDMPVMLASDQPLNAGETYFVNEPDRDIGGRFAKLSVDRLAPKNWGYVLYLDADTELTESVDFIFDILESGWEFVICKDMHDRHYLAQMNRGDNEQEYNATVAEIGCNRVMQYNGGVFAYRRTPATAAFFESWLAEYDRWAGRDQGALLRAFYKNPMRTFVLSNIWNASDRYPMPPGKVAIIHHNVEARRYGKGIHDRLDSPQAWRAVRQFEGAKNG